MNPSYRLQSAWLVRLVAIVVALVVALQGAASIAAQATPAPAGERLGVIATHSILGDLVRNVAGDAVDLQVLVGPDGDAHTFEPTPGDIAKVAEADVLFENGLDFETWLDDAYEASDSSASRIVVTDAITPLTLGEDAHADEEDDEHEDGDDEEHGEFDPHVWQNVQNAVLMVEAIRDALVTADPANAAAYEANATAYLAELEELDAYVVAQVALVPEAERIMFTSHDAFGYFAAAYGFTIEGSAIQSFSTETGDPSAGEIADLVEAIRASGVPAIFAENIENSDLIEQIASEAGVIVAPTLYSDALGQSGTAGETYVGLIRANTDTIVGALSA